MCWGNRTSEFLQDFCWQCALLTGARVMTELRFRFAQVVTNARKRQFQVLSVLAGHRSADVTRFTVPLLGPLLICHSSGLHMSDLGSAR